MQVLNLMAQTSAATQVQTQPPMLVPPTQQVMSMDPTALVAQTQGVYVKQVKQLAEAFGWQVANRYEIYPLDPNTSEVSGAQILHARERPGNVCHRQFCGPCRANITDIYLAGDPNNVLATYEKTQGLAWDPCCCKSQSTLQTFTAGTRGKYVYETPSLWCPGCSSLSFDIQNYHLFGKGGCHCAMGPCCTYRMNVKDKRSGNNQGEVTKLKQSCADMFYKTNKFNVIFPMNATPEEKVALIAAALHSDYNFFEQKANNDNTTL